jgi:adenine-specific DNA-methyltransferase
MSTFSLHHGDCIDVLKTLPDNSFDMMLTDPPCACHYRDRSGRKVANDNCVDWITPAFAEVARVMKPNTVCVSFYGWSAVEHFMTAWREAGLTPIGHIVWAKDYASKTGFLAAKHE